MVGRGRFELPTMRPRKGSACKADVLSRAFPNRAELPAHEKESSSVFR